MNNYLTRRVKETSLNRLFAAVGDSIDDLTQAATIVSLTWYYPTKENKYYRAAICYKFK